VDQREYEIRSHESDIARMEKEQQGLSARLQRLRHRQYSLELDFNELASRKQSLQDTLSQSDRRLADREQEAAGCAERVSKLQIALVESRSRIEQVESKIRHTEELQRELERTRTTKSEEIEQAEKEIVAATERTEQIEADLKGHFEKRSRLSEHQTELRTAQGEVIQRVDDKDALLREARSEKEELGERLHRLEMRFNTADAEVRAIADRMHEDYDVDIRYVEAPRPDETVSDDDARTRLGELKERLKKFGAVNLLALEEYKTACEREKFLGEQLEDLTSAKADLEQTIHRINHTARQLFNDTFEKARANFRHLFVELFTGGEADIALVDPSEPLESDVHITARPRGKKLLSITMMSGGERALTAIALLFSLYLVKPSPFCILDEIDAPLDDANCRRFLNIIEKFSEQTQFITITHNKITMEAAQNLYGVTMEQAGVSKLVAVRFTDVVRDEHGDTVIITDDDAELTASSDAEPPRETPTQPTGDEDDMSDLPEKVVERVNPSLPVTDDPQGNN
jgi:chromosome segregation protein